MEKENNKEKESIEEILSDLDNLLNKMPSILSDIKVPEFQSIEFYKPEKENEQLNTVDEPLAEKEHIETEIEMQKPAEEIVEPSDAAKISVDSGPDILSAEQICTNGPEFMTEELAPAMVEDNKEKIEIDKQNIKELASALSLEEPKDKLENLYGQTKSFSVPDIDDLFKIVEESTPGGSDKDIPQEKSPDITTMHADELAIADKETMEIGAQGRKMNLNENPKDENIFQQQNDKQQEKKPQEEISDKGFEPEKTINLEDLKEFEKVLQNSSPESQESKLQNVQPVIEVTGTEGQSLEVQPIGKLADDLLKQQPQVEIKPDITPEISGNITQEEPVGEIQPLQVSAEPGEEKQLMIEPSEIQKEPLIESPSGRSFAEAGKEKMFMSEPLEIQKEQVSGSQIPPSTEVGEEKTVVFEPGCIQVGQVQPTPTNVGEQAAPPPTDSILVQGSERQVGVQETAQDFGDKTIMVSEEGLTTSTSMQSMDLSTLVSRQPPEQIPPERIKSVGFLYSMGEENMCAKLLQEIDSICLKSKTKPMFIKRGFVKVFEPDMKGNYILEVVNQTQAIGLICVGNIPQENIYEVENVFNSSNIFFRHINQENFNHASVVNLIADLIIL